ncbi:hypothetical protein DFQ30_009881 [Apophysomyces sp. BC1015]|nr:hypothetical protein DFQ30_009881 [Apophysomyces sp. BC1015]
MFRLTAVARSGFRLASNRQLYKAAFRPSVIGRATFSHVAPLRASAHDGQGPPMHPLIDELKKHPHIIQQLADITELLQSKNLDSTKEPSFMEVMQVMRDPEIREKVQQLAKDMAEAGIQFDMSTVAELNKSFGGQSESSGMFKKFFK